MEKFLGCFMYCLILIGIFFLFSWFIMLLWNAIFPIVFGISAITYLQSCGILLLLNICFRSGSWVNGILTILKRNKE